MSQMHAAPDMGIHAKRASVHLGSGRLFGEALAREQMRANKRREARKTNNFTGGLRAKCLCACGLRFTTKGIAQHQRRCAIQQAKWNSPQN